MPVWLAWDVFGEANGVRSAQELLDRLARLHAGKRLTDRIGCVFVAFPVFFAPDDWVERPRDWKRNVVRGSVYDLGTGEGRRVWDQCTERAIATAKWTVEDVERDRYGAPVSVRPRLGQRSFRLAVLDAYDGACAVTTEHSLPVLDAAHIRPYEKGGEHAISNGLPLRKDLHRLFDLGYVTVKPDLTVAVSDRLRDEYANGKTYYAFSGRQIELPRFAEHQPTREALEWHGDEVFLG
jgi:putative restriction endonuclease